MISDEPVLTLMFSGDGQRLLTGNWIEVRVWDVTTGQPIGKPVPRELGAIALSPDGRRTATTNMPAMHQWDVESGSALGPPMTGHTIGVASLAYGPGGDYLVAAGDRGTLRFWDTQTGRQLGDAIVTSGENQSVEISRDGRRVLVTEASVETGGVPVGSRVSELPAPPAWRDKLCDKLTRNPSEEQWRQWVSPDIPYRKICPGKS